jgi:hypothetical protein
MTAKEATDALEQVQAQIASHAAGCAQCRAARYGVSLSVWRSCDEGRELERERLALGHRVYYLARKAARLSSASS